VRLGCSICLDGCFPETFAEYRRLGVHVVLHSSFVAGRRDNADAEQDALFAVRARAAAANHCYWVSMVTPSNPVQGASSQLVSPLGNVVAACRRHRRGLAVGRIDLGPGGPWQAIFWGRQWREDARCGDIYRAAATDSPRSRDRSSF
jgi:predicted amidohydrolase